MNKLGSTHPVVHYLDGYAGPGVYGDGTPGSPALAAQVGDLVAHIRDVRVTFVEKERANAEALASFVESTQLNASVHHAELSDVIDKVLDTCQGAPLLAFLDPFGLAVGFDQLVKVANRKAPTDILVNVSLSALRRNAGHLTTTSSNAQYLRSSAKIVERMDSALGGDWWRSVWLNAGTDTSRGSALAHGYANHCLRRMPGFGYFILPVADRWDGPPAFFLMLLTRHPDGLWNFNEFMSTANEKLRQYSLENCQLLPELFDPNDRYIEVVRRNILGLLDVYPSFQTWQCVGGLLGEVEGFARTTHLRAAIKSLVAEDLARARDQKGREGGKGDVDSMTITRGPRSSGGAASLSSGELVPQATV